MTRILLFHPNATAELEETACIYEDCRPDLGTEFYRDVRAKILEAVENPTRFSIYRGTHRRLRFDRWPYIVVFAHGARFLHVIGVFPALRDPNRIAQQISDRT